MFHTQFKAMQASKGRITIPLNFLRTLKCGPCFVSLCLQNTDEQLSVFTKTSSCFLKLLEDFVVPVQEIRFGNPVSQMYCI